MLYLKYLAQIHYLLSNLIQNKQRTQIESQNNFLFKQKMNSLLEKDESDSDLSKSKCSLKKNLAQSWKQSSNFPFKTHREVLKSSRTGACIYFSLRY